MRSMLRASRCDLHCIVLACNGCVWKESCHVNASELALKQGSHSKPAACLSTCVTMLQDNHIGEQLSSANTAVDRCAHSMICKLELPHQLPHHARLALPRSWSVQMLTEAFA